MATSARRIIAVNPSLSESEKTQIDADYSSGTSLTVISNFGFADDDIVVVGEPGSEKAEAKDATGVTGDTTITISAALKFDHPAGTPVYRSEYDQVEFSYMPSGGGWSVLATNTIKWDDIETIYIHQGGINTDSYRFRFKNSASGNTSEYSGTITGAGYSRDSVGQMIQNVRGVTNDRERKVVQDSEIMGFLNMAKDIIKARRNDWWFWEKEDEGTITTVADTRKYDLDDIEEDIDYIKDVRFRDASLTPVEIYQIEYLSRVEFDALVRDESETTDDHASFYNILPPDTSSSSGYIRIDPEPENTGNGSFYIRYYKADGDYDDVADTTSIPIPNVLELFAIAQIEYLKGNDARGALYEKLFHGPASRRKDDSTLTGISLLEQMQKDKLKPTSQPKQLKRFRGRNAVGRLYRGRNTTNIDSIRENYW